MNRLALSLAIASAALATQTASAAAFAGNFIAAGVIRTVAGVTQTTKIGEFPALPVRVSMCSGAIEAPVFAVTGAFTAQAIGSTYVIHATLAAPDRTMFEIVHTSATNDSIRNVVFGNGTQRIVFDRTLPAAGTPGSLSGRDVNYLGGAGMWNVRALWRNLVRIGAAAPVGDVFNTLILEFSACFSAGDFVKVEVDTDMVPGQGWVPGPGGGGPVNIPPAPTDRDVSQAPGTA
jgi:hypothetical protein